MAGREQNVGRRDRIVRAVLTPIAVAIAAWTYVSVPSGPLQIAGIVAMVILSFVLGVGALTGTCGVYAALGINTCYCEDEYAGGSSWG